MIRWSSRAPDQRRSRISSAVESVRRGERQKLGPVPVEPLATLAPVRAPALDEFPEPRRMIRDAQVAELVHDHVVEHVKRRQHEPPVEREGAACRARAPERALPRDSNSLVRDAEALALLLGERANELARGHACLGLAHGEALEPQSRDLSPSLLFNPGALLDEQAVDIYSGHPPWHGEPRRLAPRHLQPPPPRPRRPPHFDAVHRYEPSFRCGSRISVQTPRLLFSVHSISGVSRLRQLPDTAP